jgi:hypothetical protein
MQSALGAANRGGTKREYCVPIAEHKLLGSLLDQPFRGRRGERDPTMFQCQVRACRAAEGVIRSISSGLDGRHKNRLLRTDRSTTDRDAWANEHAEYSQGRGTHNKRATALPTTMGMGMGKERHGTRMYQ